MRLGLIFALSALVVILASCTPPGAKPLDQIGIDEIPKITSPVPAQPELVQNETKNKTVDVVQQPSLSNITVQDPDPLTFQAKTENCVSGVATCKGDRLLECRKGKMVLKEDCGDKGCIVDHCSACTANTQQCDGNKLVKCTADARKIVTPCYKCENKKCIDAPENPGPFLCAQVTNLETETPEALMAYSPFKKDYVAQELVVSNFPGGDKGPVELARLLKSGSFEKTKSANKGKYPVFMWLTKCYVYCIIEQPLKVSLTCSDGQTVTAVIPPHSSAVSTPFRFFVAEEGSMFYGDEDKNGAGRQLKIEDIYVKEQLASKPII